MRSIVICHEIRIVSNGYVVELYRPLGRDEVICTTWEEVITVLSNLPIVLERRERENP
jgi:hypothetical protein